MVHSLKVWYTTFNQPVTFAFITHDEQSHLPWERIQHTRYSSMQAAWAAQSFSPPGTHHCWVSRDIMGWEVCLTLLHMTNGENGTPDLLILIPTPYPLGHTLPLGGQCFLLWHLYLPDGRCDIALHKCTLAYSMLHYVHIHAWISNLAGQAIWYCKILWCNL